MELLSIITSSIVTCFCHDFLLHSLKVKWINYWVHPYGAKRFLLFGTIENWKLIFVDFITTCCTRNMKTQKPFDTDLSNFAAYKDVYQISNFFLISFVVRIRVWFTLRILTSARLMQRVKSCSVLKIWVNFTVINICKCFILDFICVFMTSDYFWLCSNCSHL